MDLNETLDAYIAASSRSWQAFLDYKFLEASDSRVALASRSEAEALAALRSRIAEVTQ